MEFHLEQVLASLPDALFLIQKNQTLSYLNPVAERMAGFSLSLAKNRPLSDLFLDAQDLCQRVQTTLDTGHSFTIRKDELLNKSEESWVVEIHIEPIHDSQGIISGVLLLLRELSAIKKMEEELRHADRLGVMGTIASGLAHEIKNPLGGIKGAAQMLAREIKQKDLNEYLQIIVKEANRVNKLITELLTFSNPKKINFSSVNINKILDEVISLEQQNLSSPQIRILRSYDPSLPKVKGDENQLKQAFLNLIKNAKEAVFKTGEIEVSTRLVTDYQLKTQRGRFARMVEIDIADTGCGMDEEALKNLFAPFYTTKKTGTGLGLAISHRIITEHQGFIQVESLPKKGSTFRIFLRAA